jgi:hypothetical protein
MRARLAVGIIAALMAAGTAAAAEPGAGTRLTIEAATEAFHGEVHHTTVVLTDSRGNPLQGETVALYEELRLFDYTDMSLVGEERTDHRGVATFAYIPPMPGRSLLAAEYPGSDTFGPATATATITVHVGTGVVTPVIPEPSPPLLPRGVTAAWFLPLLMGVWLALGVAVYHLVHIPAQGAPGRGRV